jgi:hypothetical protein
MNNIYKIATFLTAFLVTNISFAESAQAYEDSIKSTIKSPLGCRDVGYKFYLNTLKIMPEDVGDRQSLYFVYNKLNTNINLWQMLKSNSTRSAYLNRNIIANNWAVLATGEKEVHYICTVSDNKSKFGKIVDCSKSVKVCEYARVKFGLNNKGNFWLVKSASRGHAVGEVVRYGIIPR